ncbi:hypothetical protein K431DRAFT_286431 [Polychaeton citri CBS 116435]|uniref:F-box domain-containing protein n=1 Tax=Polychaeton citri CBS 116435 TaxID=1314669 RepID=A0A9P4Q3A5_9PEZI|nr:hypothetical protein K431DRAFT_286431 [Polychaeton citri CBS 116435]
MPAPPTASLMGLPYELREQILQPVLLSSDLLETQPPLWGSNADFVHPVMQVCRLLRAEALETFFRTNRFRWVFSTTSHHRTDPIGAKLRPDIEEQLRPFHRDADPLPSAIPWLYPHLATDLRHLTLLLHMRRYSSAEDLASFALRLRAAVQALDHGRRLRDLRLVITMADLTTSLTGAEIEALRALWEIRVAGGGEVGVRFKVLPPGARVGVEAVLKGLPDRIMGKG